jgi:hypothetical protein
MEARLDNNKSISAEDVRAWVNTAPPEQVTQIADTVLQKIATYSPEHQQRFSSRLNSNTRALFTQSQTA